ncbi:uncharacterized protein LOC126971776 [Leptidea sinapis]|uniref:uncharacterized protein LOC126971776 n=1 Tax=Leptidea sinapis TaxID=189913 RepID=UPI00213EDDF5|nr:uncharacterized protein LOC126971776 [Leptidea sinapis]
MFVILNNVVIISSNSLRVTIYLVKLKADLVLIYTHNLIKMNPQIRQAIVLSGLMMCSISDGYIFGQMSGMIDSLRSPDSSIRLTDDDISWIASILNMTCLCGYALLAVVCEYFGRGKTVGLLSIPVLASWIMVYFAQDRIILLASRVIVGVFYGGILILTYICVGEYIPYRTRAFHTNFMSSVGNITGTTLGHVLSIVLHWRTVALIGIIPTTLSIILALCWEESPSWLAGKRRFDDCEKSFKSLHMPSIESDRELKSIIAHEKQKQSECSKFNQTSFWSRTLSACKRKYFWRIMGLSFVTQIYRIAGGRILFSTFAITMLQDITGHSYILLFTLAVDGCGIIGALISCGFIRKFKMRKLILVSGTISNLILILTSVSLFYLNDTFVNVCIKIGFLALYFITVYAGPYAVMDSLLSEIFPLEIKTFCMFLLGLMGAPIQFLAIKTSPGLFLTIGYHGVLLINAGIVTLCLIYLWAYLPETKGRTLQEIEYYFHNGKYENTCSAEWFKNDQIVKINANYKDEQLY